MKKKRSKKKSSKKPKNKTKKLLILIALIAFNLFIMLDVGLGLAGLIIGLFAAGIGLVLGGAAGFFFSLIYPLFPNSWVVQYVSLGGVSSWALVFLSLSLTCIGGLIVIGMSYVTKYFYKAVKWYVKLNVDVFKEYAN